ncbi:hypothetical protein SAMN05660831_02085 [Thiohalospira halophila DSM 15071]|uniref:Haemolysin XhlA n=1 Tax=Thiohalospira halophila DSM 15071 TaxID=1123397 RepID=A0A1I1UAD4_9GAMM|nr:hypothetical protein [Thiohalospira halophila]SFD67707.1 hypothetical protein SAMN05660831_02085 [Thiohalospira halophila DSM 15071]
MSDQPQTADSPIHAQVAELRARMDGQAADHDRIREEIARERETRESEVGALRTEISEEARGRQDDYRGLMSHIQGLESRFGTLEGKINRMIWAVGLVGATIAVIGGLILWVIQVGNGVGIL